MAFPMPRDAPVTIETGASTSFGDSATAAADSVAAACDLGARENSRLLLPPKLCNRIGACGNPTDAMVDIMCNCWWGNAMHPCCSRCTVPHAAMLDAAAIAAIAFGTRGSPSHLGHSTNANSTCVGMQGRQGCELVG
jgi:hypothetical protein